MSTKIVAVSGRKQSGKSSLCAIIQAKLAESDYRRFADNQNLRKEPCEISLPYKVACQNTDGTILWYHVYNHSEDSVYDDTSRKVEPLNVNIESKIYSFADVLKEICVSVLGLTTEQCYGTDDQKNSLTKLRWESLPEYVRWINGSGVLKGYNNTLEKQKVTENQYYHYKFVEQYEPVGVKSGLMTGREVMQVFGTDVMRKMFHNDVWVHATINKIENEYPKVALIADMRFRTEFEALYAEGAYVIRLERKITEDNHSSEIDFDGFDWSQYDRVCVVPAEADIHTKNNMVLKWLRQKAGMEF